MPGFVFSGLWDENRLDAPLRLQIAEGLLPVLQGYLVGHQAGDILVCAIHQLQALIPGGIAGAHAANHRDGAHHDLLPGHRDLLAAQADGAEFAEFLRHAYGVGNGGLRAAGLDLLHTR